MIRSSDKTNRSFPCKEERGIRWADYSQKGTKKAQNWGWGDSWIFWIRREDLSEENGVRQRSSIPSLYLIFRPLVEFSASVIFIICKFPSDIPQHVALFVQNPLGVNIPCTINNSALVDSLVIFAYEFSAQDIDLYVCWIKGIRPYLIPMCDFALPTLHGKNVFRRPKYTRIVWMRISRNCKFSSVHFPKILLVTLRIFL